MSSSLPDYSDEEARRRLLGQAEDRLAGPGGGAGGWTGPAPTYRVQQQAAPAPTAAFAAPGPYRPAAGPTTYARPSPVRKGQTVSWLALLLALAAGLMVGLGVYGALAGVEFSQHPFAQASDRATLAAVGAVLGLLAMLVAVIALFRARPRLIATVALLLALVGPWIAAFVGGKLGADAFGEHASAALGGTTEDLGQVFTELLVLAGVDPEPYRRLIEIVFGS